MFGGKVVNVCNQRNILNGRIQNQCIDMANVLASLMKAAIHLLSDFLMNSEIYKNTKFENITSVFNKTRKLKKEHSEEILNVEFLEYSSLSWTRSIWPMIKEGKSRCLRLFRSLRRTGKRYSRSNRKMERPSWRAQDVFVVPRCSGTRNRVVILSSKVSMLRVVGSWCKRKADIPFLYMEILWIQNSCSKQFVLPISSVLTEQLRIGVINSVWQKKQKGRVGILVDREILTMVEPECCDTLRNWALCERNS